MTGAGAGAGSGDADRCCGTASAGGVTRIGASTLGRGGANRGRYGYSRLTSAYSGPWTVG